MNFHNTKDLQDHYKQVDRNLRSKKAWHPPEVRVCWWTPTVIELLPGDMGVPTSMRRYVYHIMYEHDLTWSQLIGDSKVHDVVEARQLLWYTACVKTKLSACHLGRIFHRDHTTILSGVMAYCFKNKLTPPRGMSFKNKHYKGRFDNYREKL